MVRDFLIEPYEVTLHFATTRKEWKALAKRFPVIGGVPASAGQTSSGGDHFFVWVDIKQLEKIDDSPFRTIVHEAYHASAAILDRIGQDYDANSEAMAYLIEYVASLLWESTTS